MPERLPEAFRDLEIWMEWSLPTESERGAKRRASSMQELEAFYAGMMARMSEVLPYLEQSSARDIPVETGARIVRRGQGHVPIVKSSCRGL